MKLEEKTVAENPLCPNCGKHLKSMGKNQGYRCEKCNEKFPQLKKNETVVYRTLREGLYVTSTRSQRHLTKPLRRYGLEKTQNEHLPMIESWHSSIA